ncbi:hypothetical protein [Nonomuraea deserti]|uniref:hypothetical protein n=1 Tax=Nonomuraea deserti TaxID=1848322 RepID=UPI001FEB33D8|nr:hypothetical protein [Nonomuraea deserti]
MPVHSGLVRRWLPHRRTTWPHTTNPHVLISDKTAHSTGPISQQFVTSRMNRTGYSVGRIRKDRILHEALTGGADPLHLSLIFEIFHSTVARYSAVAEHLLADEPDQTSRP